MNFPSSLSSRGPWTSVVLGPSADQAAKAIDDLVGGLMRWELWGTLGWHDIRQRYRRSSLGPVWLTISMGGMVGSLGLLYGGLLGQPIRDYLPYLASGFIVWGLISGIMLDSCNVFISAADV